jgi:hypothetical protein
MRRVKQFIKYTLIFYAIIGMAYWIFTRPAHLSWGATTAEQQMKMPADELISSNRVVTTRAISIKAPKEIIWPWIAQTGQNRGGFNSYYWLENLFAAKMQNADSIVSQWQNPQPGDSVYYGEGEGYELISFVKRNEYYSLGGWTFILDSVDTNYTRLIVRYPSMEVKQSGVTKAYYYGLFESLHFIMEAGMMMGIKKRAEEKLNR